MLGRTEFTYIKTNILNSPDLTWNDAKGSRGGIIEKNELSTYSSPELWNRLAQTQRLITLYSNQNKPNNLAVALCDPQVRKSLDRYNVNPADINSDPFLKEPSEVSELGIFVNGKLSIADTREQLLNALPVFFNLKMNYIMRKAMAAYKKQAVLEDPLVQSTLSEHSLNAENLRVTPTASKPVTISDGIISFDAELSIERMITLLLRNIKTVRQQQDTMAGVNHLKSAYENLEKVLSDPDVITAIYAHHLSPQQFMITADAKTAIKTHSNYVGISSLLSSKQMKNLILQLLENNPPKLDPLPPSLPLPSALQAALKQKEVREKMDNYQFDTSVITVSNTITQDFVVLNDSIVFHPALSTDDYVQCLLLCIPEYFRITHSSLTP